MVQKAGGVLGLRLDMLIFKAHLAGVTSGVFTPKLLRLAARLGSTLYHQHHEYT